MRNDFLTKSFTVGRDECVGEISEVVGLLTVVQLKLSLRFPRRKGWEFSVIPFTMVRPSWFSHIQLNAIKPRLEGKIVWFLFDYISKHYCD